MKAYLTTIGEPTTEVSAWSLERNGFEVVRVVGGGLLADKLKTVYELAEDDFMRIDADVVVNQDFTPDFVRQEIAAFPDAWWLQFQCFDWLKLNLSYGGVQFIKKEAIPALRSHVDGVHGADRPETALSRIDAFYNPRRFESSQTIIGLHGFALGEHTDRVLRQKKKRNHFATYDFELAAKLEGLLK